MSHILFYFFLCLCLGIAFDTFLLGFAPVAYGFITAFSLALAFLFRKNSRTFITFVALSSVVLGGFLHATSPRTLVASQWDYFVERLDGRQIAVEGTVSRELRRSVVFGKPRANFILDHVRFPGLESRAPRGAVKVYLRDDYPELRYGQRLELRGVLESPGGPMNPAGFDEKKYLASKKSFAKMRAEFVRAREEQRIGLDSMVYGVRNFLLGRMDEALGVREAGVAKAIFLGERTGLEREIKDAFARTGTFHLFAISGLHVGLIAFMTYFLLGLLPLGERFRSLVTVAVLVFYCLLTGSNPPVVRATLMAAVYLGGRILYRESNALNSLGFAGAILLAWNPDQLWDVGFQLSFIAVWGLIVFAPRFVKKEDLRDARSRNLIKRIGAQIRFLFIASLVAWGVTAPVVIHNFHRIYGLAPLVNVLLIPLVFLTDLTLVIFSLLSFIPMGLDSVFNIVVGFWVGTMMAVVRWFENLSLFSWALKSWVPWTWGVMFMGLGVIAHRRVISSSRVRMMCFALCLANCILLDAAIATARPQPFRATFFDVGQGDSIFFEFPKGGNLLVDAGTGGEGDQGRWVIQPYLESRGIRKIDALVLTHPHFDHAGGFTTLVQRFDVGLVLDNGQTTGSSFYRELTEEIEARGIPRVTVGRGQALVGFPEVEVRFLHPVPRTQEAHDFNNYSVVTEIRAGGRSYLLAGDIVEKGMKRLLKAELRPVDVLKVPHHGSRIGPLGAEFLRHVDPELAVIQAGRRNRHGHPHPETVDMLASVTERLYRTDLDGAVQIEVSGGRRPKTLIRTPSGEADWDAVRKP